MPLNSEHLLKAEVALDALLNASDLQAHALHILALLQRLVAIQSLSAELEPTVLTRKAKAVADTIVSDFRSIQMLVTLLEKMLSGQDPFPSPPPPRRRRRLGPDSRNTNPNFSKGCDD